MLNRKWRIFIFMQLQREFLPNYKTANESNRDWTQVVENTHTGPSYSFAHYCEAQEVKKRKAYFQEEFHLEHCRHDIFGDHNGCDAGCEGTGWLPVSKSNMNEPLRHLWVAAEIDTPSDDGWHLIPCPKCNPITELDEHIVKKGSQFELKSKKSGKNLGTYKSKAGAEKREGQVEYFKHLKEDEVLPGHPKDVTDSGHDEKKKVTLKDTEKVLGEELLPSDHNKQQSQAKKDKKKAAETKPVTDKDDSGEKKKEKAKESRDEKERARKAKKLLPYEFVSQKDAERSAGHLGLHGAHTAGNGVYKPGSSDYSLRDAVAAKKAKQKQRGTVHEDTVSDRSADSNLIDKQNLPEMIQKIKESYLWKNGVI